LAAATAAAAQQETAAPHRMGRAAATPAPFSAESAAPVSAEVPDPSPYPVRGVDVSHYDGDIAWAKLRTSGLAFVFIKATDGVDIVDDKFAQNWAGASQAGLAKGAYHFYDFCESGGAQADLFTKTVPADATTLPPTIDLEQSKECRKMPAKAAFRKSLAAFVAKVRAKYHRDPLLYINDSIYAKYFAGENDSYKIWIADVRHTTPDLPTSWAFWQYGWHGHVDGIDNEVDLDAFAGTFPALADLGGGTSSDGTMLAFLR
jgi:lysozyme